MKAPPIVPQKPKRRFDVYGFFNGISEEGKAGLDSGRTRSPLVKTFLLEHVAARSGRVPRSPTEILRELGHPGGSPCRLQTKTLRRRSVRVPCQLAPKGAECE